MSKELLASDEYIFVSVFLLKHTIVILQHSLMGSHSTDIIIFHMKFKTYYATCCIWIQV